MTHYKVQNLSLLTDLYQLTMGEAYFQNNKKDNRAVFHLFYRTAPFNGEYCIAAGLEDAIKVIENFHFSLEDIQYLESLKGQDNQQLFSKEYLNYLNNLKITCDIHAVVEGSIVFPKTPIMRIEGPIIECQLLETILLNIINFQTLIATKASKIKEVCGNDSLLEFGLRRAQGTNGGLSASRAAYIGGVDATSNTLAGKDYKIPVKGTHAHSWVMSFDNELEAFFKYANVMPHNCILLVDTYDTIKGVKNAIIVADHLKTIGHQLIGIRLDSGDLADLSIKCRIILDEAGHRDVKIVASNDLDEYRIKKLKEAGARIDIWGVGTKLVTSFDTPALGGVYKLAAIKENLNSEYQYKIKISNDPIKNSLPGILQVNRIFRNNIPQYDIIVDQDSDHKADDEFQSTSQLVPIFLNAKKVYTSPETREIKDMALKQISFFKNTKDYEVKIHDSIKEKINKIKNREIE